MRLVLSHGNGLAIEGYRCFWEALTDEFEVVVFDLRNHGRSGNSALAHHTIARFAEDMEFVWRTLNAELGPKTSIGVFHSVSALAGLLHQSQRSRWHGLVLVDPPIAPPPAHALRATHLAEIAQMGAAARRRRAVFAAPSELAERLQKSLAFRLVGSDELALLAEALLTMRDDGRYGLACLPQYEAQIFETNTVTDAWDALSALCIPVQLLCRIQRSPAFKALPSLGRPLHLS